ncbi:sortase [Prauserella marina]|uniref:Sortase family protein n=1 Tax=Prauserella marina TaxID=530584 RepID=A0A222VMQ3_9PSEU|nr:class F sortase [Prauserella marina]ASR35195.1 sortase [Prauserella marina]PWV85039.1 sortase family protein [Prauserella marina]SDC06216.1 Sortase family protein [Prauserella marina]
MRRRGLAAWLGAVAVVAVAAGTILLTQRGEQPSPSAAPPAPPVTTESPAPPPSTTEVAPKAEPARRATASAQQPGTVRLPDGGTATLVRKEVTPDGTLPIPDGLGEATWWGAELGADQGVALLSGHVNWNGQTGPFAELWRDQTGQRVTVVDADGGHWVYEITEAVTLHKNELPRHAGELFAQDGPHRLVLVTCGGDYVGGTDGYEDNRIVTARLLTRP